MKPRKSRLWLGRKFTCYLVLLAMLFSMAGMSNPAPVYADSGTENNPTVASAVYTVTVDSGISGGALAVEPASGAAGDTITVTVTPDSGKRLVAGSLKYNDGANEFGITATEGVYSFLMPAADVTVTAQFEDIPAAGENPTVTIGNVTAAPGQDVTVEMTIAGYPGIGFADFYIVYDISALSMKTIATSPETIFTGYSQGAVPSLGWYNLVLGDLENAVAAGGTDITVSMTFTVSESAASGNYPLTFSSPTALYSSLEGSPDDIITATYTPGQITVTNAAPSYTVSTDSAITGGTVTVDPASGAAGDTITVTVTPDTGKRLVADSLKYTADGGSTYTPVTETDGVYSFVLPAADVTVTAQFEDELAGGSAWDGATIDTIWYTGAEPGATSYTITTPAQLAGLAALVNGTVPGIAQDDFAGKTVILGSDIRLDSSSTKYTAAYGRFGTASFAMETTWYAVYADANIWTPIGSGVATGNSAFSSTNFFSGTFDGAGYTVSGLYTNIDNTVQGLFGCVGQGGMVKNVTVEGCVSGKFVVGGIAAYLNGGTVQNCVNKAIVYADGGEKADSGLENGPNKIGAVGGIVGSMTGTSAAPATIASCTNYQPVTCTNTNQGGRTGGILGISDKATDYGSISNCVNFGVVDGYQYSGGIAGLIASVNVPITNCGNTALVSGHSSGHCYVGGIVAQTESNIINCYSTGDYRSSIDGNAGDKASNVGGIAGNNGLMGVSHIINCYATGTFVVGGNTVHMSGATVGLICGVTQKMGDLVNCYYLDTAVQPSGSNTNDLTRGYISANDARTEAQMKAAPFLAELNGDGRAFVADTAPNLNSGFPVLRHQLTDTSTITGIVKEADPTTLHYVAGQTFNTAGLLIKANYSDGTSEYITDYTLSIPGELAPTDTAITVSGTYDGMAYSYTFEIVVAANELLSIAITARPITTLYVVGEYFDPTGMVVKATYSNGKIETITEYSFASAPLTKADTAETISYTYNGVTMTAEQAITVVEGPGLEDDIYILSAPDHLIWFADHVNAGGNVSARAKLTGDIDLSGFTWTPIGTNANKYAGTFDGGGYQITLNIAAGSTANQGLFGYVAGATVKNLTTAGSVATTGSYAAGLVARAEGVTIQNCVNKATVSGNQYVAGLLGNSSANTATVTGSSNEGAINAAGNYSSGLVAYITGGADNSMQNCTNKGTVSGTTNTGGILGYINTVVAIADCVNEGAVGGTQNVGGVAGNATNAGTSLTRSGNTAAITGTSYNVGGILGNSGANASLSECYNTGAVSGTYNVGGILGSSRVLIANCYNTGNVSASAGSSSQGAGGIVGTYTNSSITNCYSTGTVTGTGSGPAGAVVGRLTSGSIVNCYYLEGAAASGVGNGTDETTFKTSGELKSGEFAALLGAAYIAHSDAYPILAWQGAAAPETYSVTVDGSISGGTVAVSPASAAAGETITVTVTLDSGKRLVAGSLQFSDGAADTEIIETDGVYSFVMPAANVTVSAQFEDLSAVHTISMTTDYTISTGGIYQIASGSTGIITVSTADPVTIVGNGIEATGKLQKISIDYTVPNANLTIQDLYIEDPYNPELVGSVIDFTGVGNKLTLQGTSLLEALEGSACIHVGVGTALTITGEGTLYFYKDGKSAGIGGNGSEYNGAITFDGGKILGKGTAMAAVVGSGSYMENNIVPGSTPGDIRILSGELTLLANARGAAIGQGAGSDSLFTGNVYISGGLITVNVDWSGAAIGNGGGSPAPNFTEGGKVYITGGSLRTFIDKNAASGWGYTEGGVYPKAITAAKKNLAGETLYLLRFDTNALATPANDFEVTIDGQPYYQGGLHKYRYVNEDSLKYTEDPWIDITTTMSNWGPLEDNNLYFYVNEESHTIVVNNEVFTVPANALASLAVTTPPASTLYAAGETFNPAGMVVTAIYTNGKTETLTADAYTLSPDTGTALTPADTKITISYTYEGVTMTAEQSITVLASPAPGKNADDVYELATADHMLWFANQVNTGLNNAVKGKLMNDIDLSGVTWTPIGSSSALTFGGAFDGDGKTITLALNSSDAGGLFGYLNGATVKNLTVAGSVTGGQYTAGIAGRATAAVLENCVNKATITSTASDVGGIAGYTTGATTVSGCTNNGAVTAAYNVGGIVGRAYGADTISRCANNGAVTATSAETSATYSAGGIVGYAHAASTIELCYNTGPVKGGVLNVGGVAGYLRNASAKVINSYNTGSVIGENTSDTANTGGVVGYTNNASCSVQNCYNAGAVTANNTGLFTAGVIGYAAGNTNVSNNYYLNTTASIGLGYAEDNAVSKTAEELKFGAFAALLGAAYIVQSDAYPILAWQGATAPETYTVTVDGAITGGAVGVHPASAAAGETITVTVTPDSGKQLVAGSLQYNDGAGDIEIIVAEGVYSFLMPAANVTVTALFEDLPASADFTYTLSGTTATITGYTGTSGVVYIPETITDNGTEYTVTAIADNAFQDCTGLTSITIPNSVTTIGNFAFMNTGLTSITIPNSVTTIGRNTFMNCAGLTSITIPNSVTTIGNNALRNCTSLTSVTIPDSVTTIGDGALMGCTALTSITIPNSVTAIGKNVLRICTSLTSVTIPDSVTTIGEGAFAYCDALTSITIPSSVTSIGTAAFSYAGLTSVIIPGSVATIGSDAFTACSALASVTIQSGVTSIASAAFYMCTDLTSITIPASVTSIGNYAFCLNTNLTSAYFLGAQPAWGTEAAFESVAPGFVLYYHVNQSSSWSGFTAYTAQPFCILTLDLQDGSAPAGNYAVVDANGHISPFQDPARLDHTFGGWYKEAACANAFDFGSETVTGDLTLYAKWTAATTENPKYTVTPVEDEAVYGVGETGGIKTMTVKAGVTGLKYFGTQITPVVEHEGQEAVVFTHLRDGVQLSLNITKADFDLVDEAQSGFNVEAGDVVKVFIVDDLTNDIDFNPTLLQ